MPGPITHYLFAHKLQHYLLAFFPFLSTYQSYYDAGSLGPDPFFFNGAFSIQSENKINTRAFGKQLHLQSPQVTFEPIFQSIPQLWMDKNQCLAYTLGFLTHYVLDETLHPFVFYWSGFDEHGGIESMPYKTDHIRFEHTLDLAWIIGHGQNINEINPSIVLRMEEDVLANIEKFYKKIYGHGNAFASSYQSMIKAYDLVYLIKDWKRKLMGFLFSKRSFLYALTHDRTITQDKFSLVTNTTQKPWRHPSLGTVQTQDVFSLALDAERKMKRLTPILHRLFHAFYPETIIATLLKEIGLQNFDGDKPFASKTFFQSIYPAYRQQPTWKTNDQKTFQVR